jgi:UDP-3-O-[3-hydroxymyristoyl] glucosamine N-acyltransferase
MMPIYILGEGGHAKVVASIIERTRGTVLGFISPEKEDKFIHSDELLALGLGNFKLRKKLMDKFGHHRFPAIIDPSAVVIGSVGYGTVVCPFGYVGVDAVVGYGCIINTSVTVDHDCEVGHYVNINPGVHIGGGTIINSSLYIGMGNNIIHGQTVEENMKSK